MGLLRTRTARHASFIAVVNFASAILRFCVTVLMAKILIPAEWGNIAVFIALMDIVSVLCDSGLNATLVRFVAGDTTSRATTVFGRCLTMKAAIAAMLFGVLWALREPIVANQQFPEDFHWVYPLAISAGLFLSFLGLFLSVFQAKQAYGLYSLGYLSVNTLRGVGLAIVVVAGLRSVDAVTVPFFCAPIVALVLTLPLVILTLKPGASLPRPAVSWKTMVAFAAPLSIMGAIAIGNMRISNFMLKTLASPEAVANYELAYQIGFVFPLFTGALITVLLPKVSAMQTQAELGDYRRRLLRMYPIVLSLTLAGMVIGPWFISLVFGTKYAASLPIIRLLLIGFGVHVITHPLGLVFYAVSRPICLAGIYLAQFVVMVSLNYFLIPKWEGIGAALALSVSLLVAAVAVVGISGWVIKNFPHELHETNL
ncbi:MAG: oligosaccharide flippase family protein [Candidatus Hydrogenedentota bacterium]